MQPLTLKNKLAYGAGDFGNALTFNLMTSYLVMYYTDVAKISAVIIGVLFFVASMWDAIFDPYLGAYIDNSKGTEAGKYRPFILRYTIPLALVSIIVFMVPSALSPVQKIGWAFVTFIGWRTIYSLVNIPYGSLSTVMTKDPAARAELAVSRGLGSNLAGALDGIAIPFLLATFAKKISIAFLVASILVGVIVVICHFITYRYTKENYRNDPTERYKVKFSDFVLLFTKNPSFAAIALASFFEIISYAIGNNLRLYYFRDSLHAIQILSIVSTVALPLLFIQAPIISYLVKRSSPEALFKYTTVISFLPFVLILLVPESVWVVGGLFGLATIFRNFPGLMLWGLVSDTADYQEMKTGKPSAGLTYGVFMFVRKIGQGVGGLVSGVGLAVVGYDANLAHQTISTLTGIKFLTFGCFIASGVITFICMQFVWKINNATREQFKLLGRAD
ncbi:MFS transporter [Silvimonas soli]|uniref:MFS transporter n=1 Tax=Silvimonas soli TaxID=2980100 RepID=UPI0024B3B2E4|nr:glycoside-pentoside-hexuronide (GPH):cation symporter [Silvimonas soli]